MVARYDAIIFDLDGTLWDASESSAMGWEAGLRSADMRDLRISSRDIQSVSGQPFPDCVATLLPGLSLPEHEGLVDAIDANERLVVESQGGVAYEGVVAGMGVLAERYPLFLVSNCQEWYLAAFWKHVPIERFFRATDCFGKSGVQKAQMIMGTVARYGLRRPIYVGDTEGDRQAAEAAKVDFGYAAYGFGDVRHSAVEFATFENLVQWFTGASPG